MTAATCQHDSANLHPTSGPYSRFLRGTSTPWAVNAVLYIGACERVIPK